MSIKENVLRIFRLGVKQGIAEGKEKQVFGTAKDELELIEGERLVKFEILPYSRMYNLSSATHIRIRKQAYEKTELSEEDKVNIEKCIASDQKYYDDHRLDVNAPLKIACVLGGWYCEPLKKYLTENGYRISSCGNDFDLWITLNESRTKDEQIFFKDRAERHRAEFEYKLNKERESKLQNR